MIRNIKDNEFMKRLALIVLGVLLIFCLLSCGKKDDTDKNIKGETPKHEVEDKENVADTAEQTDTNDKLSAEESNTDNAEQADTKTELPMDESDNHIAEQSDTQTEQPQGKQDNDVPEQDEEDTQSPDIGIIEMPFVPAK